MIARILLVAVAAGVIAGAFATAAQAVKVIPLIYQAETYEKTASAAKTDATADLAHTGAEAEDASHAHGGDNSWAPADGFERLAYTLATNILLGVGLSFLLTAVIVIAGFEVSWKTGALWGVAGFMAFTLIPSISLPPEMPGMVASDIAGRQIWWGSAVISAVIGLALLVFNKKPVFKILGLGVIALPHIIGAPHADLAAGTSAVPAELATQFVMATLLSAGLFWLVLGASVGGLMQRFGKMT